MLRVLPGLTIALFLGPVVAGLLGTLLPAFGYGVLMATNMLGFNVEPAAEELEARLMQLFPPS